MKINPMQGESYAVRALEEGVSTLKNVLNLPGEVNPLVGRFTHAFHFLEARDNSLAEPKYPEAPTYPGVTELELLRRYFTVRGF